MNTITQKTSPFIFIVLFIATSVFSWSCTSNRKVIKKPNLGSITEFHREPVRLIPVIYTSYVTRGQDYAKGDNVSTLDSMGGGLGLFIRTSSSEQWIGHKLFYYYIDIDASPEYSGQSFPGDKSWVFSSYPGIYMRSYLPFWLKFYWGGGINIRYGEINYDRWGVYTQMGVELLGFTGSTIVIAHPGQPNFETEYRFGYMFNFH